MSVKIYSIKKNFTNSIGVHCTMYNVRHFAQKNVENYNKSFCQNLNKTMFKVTSAILALILHFHYQLGSLDSKTTKHQFLS